MVKLTISFVNLTISSSDILCLYFFLIFKSSKFLVNQLFNLFCLVGMSLVIEDVVAS
jgi:hypothetical protein